MSKLLIALVAAGVLNVAPAPARAQTKDSSGDVGTGKVEEKKDERAEGIRERRKRAGIMYTKDEDALYDAFANLTVPEKNRVMPWIVALALAGGVLFIALKQSFRNRYEG
jgi:hypothetical protein